MRLDLCSPSRSELCNRVRDEIEAALPSVRVREVAGEQAAGENTYSRNLQISETVTRNGLLRDWVILSPDVVVIDRETDDDVAVVCCMPRLGASGQIPNGFLNLLGVHDAPCGVVTEEPSLTRLAKLAYEHPGITIFHTDLAHLEQELMKRNAGAAELLQTLESQDRIQGIQQIRNLVDAD